jgi:hypothetical protein
MSGDKYFISDQNAPVGASFSLFSTFIERPLNIAKKRFSGC